MCHSLLIAVISLATAISASNVAEVLLIEDQNEAHVERQQELTKVYVNFLRSLDPPFCAFAGMTRLKGYIFILCMRKYFEAIRVYEDATPFDLLMLIPIADIHPWYFASSAVSECLYVIKYMSPCIWKIALGDHQLRKWVCRREIPMTLTATTDGQVVAVDSDETSKRLYIEIYGPDSDLIRRINLSGDREPFTAILRPNGQFVTFHTLDYEWYRTLVISLITPAGQVISQVNATDIGSIPPSDMTCWSFQSGAIQKNDFNSSYNRECISYDYKSAYLLLEETIIPLRVSWRSSYGRYNMILVDPQVDIGRNSPEINLIIYKC